MKDRLNQLAHIVDCKVEIGENIIVFRNDKLQVTVDRLSDRVINASGCLSSISYILDEMERINNEN